MTNRTVKYRLHFMRLAPFARDGRQDSSDRLWRRPREPNDRILFIECEMKKSKLAQLCLYKLIV